MHPYRISPGRVRVQFVGIHIVTVNPLSREGVFAFLLCTETSSPFIETVPVRACVQEQNPKQKRERGCAAGLHGVYTLKHPPRPPDPSCRTFLLSWYAKAAPPVTISLAEFAKRTGLSIEEVKHLAVCSAG